MSEFYITIKMNGKRIEIFDKLPIILNTTGNLVTQAEEFVNGQLDNLGIEQNLRSEYSWKIFRKQSNGYGMVTISRNWDGS